MEKTVPIKHLYYLDGLRGLAALYVVLHHCRNWSEFGYKGVLPGWHSFFSKSVAFGGNAVVLFIVLSGYCLGMPVAKSSDNWFPGGLKRYFARRAWRIIPPYYVALVIPLLILAFLPSKEAMQSIDPGIKWTEWLPSFRLDTISSHLLLIHNLKPKWVNSINGPTWTIASEWQLYFLLPVLVWVWRKSSLIIMASIGVGLCLLAPYLPHLTHTGIRFLASFTLGLVGAIISFAPRYKDNAKAKHLANRSGLAALFFLCLYVAILNVRAPFAWPSTLADTIFGASASLFLIYLYEHGHRENEKALAPIPTHLPAKLFRRVLSLKPIVALGTISYSLYLIHAPIIVTLQYFARIYNWSYIETLASLLSAGVGASLIVATILYFCVEKPPMNIRR